MNSTDSFCLSMQLKDPSRTTSTFFAGSELGGVVNGTLLTVFGHSLVKCLEVLKELLQGSKQKLSTF